MRKLLILLFLVVGLIALVRFTRSIEKTPPAEQAPVSRTPSPEEHHVVPEPVEQTDPSKIGDLPERPDEIEIGADEKNPKQTPESPGQQTATERFIGKYESINIGDVLKTSTLLNELGSKNAGVLATRTELLMQTPEGPVRVYSSFSGGSLIRGVGCVAVKGSKTLSGSLGDGSVRILSLPDEDAFGVLIRKDDLIVYYGNVSTWGRTDVEEEPRVVLYYRRDETKRWRYLGKATEQTDRINPVVGQNLSHQQFCDVITQN